MPAMSDSRPPLAKALFNRRMLICIFTGFSSGLPLYILINLLPAWLRTEHVDLKAIGLFALIGLPFTWKFIWSPLVDRYALPLLGRRRGWMLVTQVALIASLPLFGALAAAAGFVDDRLPRRGGGLFRRDAGHRPRCLSPRAAARSRAGSGQRDPRAGLPDLEPRSRRAVADPRRPAALAERLFHHRAVHAAGHRQRRC